MEREFISKLLNKISFPEVKESYDTNIMNTYPTSLNNALSRIIMLFFLHPNLYLLIDDIFKDKLRIECEKNFRYYFLADFLNNDLGEHLKNTKDIYIRNDSSIGYDADLVLCMYDKHKKNKDFKEFLFATILNSDSFAQSESISKYILPDIINDFSKRDCERLLNLFNNNNQYYRLLNSEYYRTNKSLKDFLGDSTKIILNKLGDDFDKSKLTYIQKLF